MPPRLRRRRGALPMAALAATIGLAGVSSPQAYAQGAEPWVAISSEVHCVLHSRNGEECISDESTLILDERARANLGTRSLIFPETYAVSLDAAYTATADGQRIDVAPEEIQNGAAPGDNSGFLGARFIKLAFRNVQVGSRLHLRYRTTAPTVTPFEHVSKVFRGSAGAVRWDSLLYVAEADVPLYVRSEHDALFKLSRSADGRRIAIQARAPIHVPASRLGSDFAIRDLARIDISSTDSWQTLLEPVAAGFDARLHAPLPAAMHQASASLRQLPERERVSRILQYVREHLRYLGDWRESIHGYLPFTLQEIDQRGFGDCKDLALVTTALLNAAGIEAHVALIHAGDTDSPPLLPNQNYLNHAIVVAQIAGKIVWLDPTLAANSLSAPPPQEQDRIAFVLGEDGKVSEHRIPQVDLSSNRTLQLVELTPADKQWKVDAKIVRAGIEAVGLSGTNLSDAERDERELREILPAAATLLERQIDRGSEQTTLIDQQVVTINARVNHLTKAIGSYQLYDPGYLGNTLAALRSFLANPGREDFHQFVASHTRLVRIHQTSALEAVQACSASSPWIDLTLTPLAVADGVGYQIDLTKKQAWIRAAEMRTAAFSEFVEVLENCASHLRLLLK